MKKITLLLLLLSVSITAQDFVQADKVVPSDRNTNGQFGRIASISGDYAIVGDYLKNSQKGIVYVFEKDNVGNWSQVQTLEASDGVSSDRFGISLKISGSYIVVGATNNRTDASGGNSKLAAGAAYVFERNSSGVWNQVNKLVPSGRSGLQGFGANLSISGSIIAIGNKKENSNTGAVYLFERQSSGSWIETEKITASDAAANTSYGGSIAIDGNNIIITATDSSTAKVYIYEKSGSVWSETQTISKGSYLIFGRSVKISGDNILFTSRNSFGNQLVLHFYKKNNSTGVWELKTNITGLSSTIGGTSIDLSGNKAIVGYTSETTDANGANSISQAGGAYLYKQNLDGTWSYNKKIVQNPRRTVDLFGAAAAIDGNRLFITATHQDFDENEANRILNSGAAYIFETSKPAGISFGLKLWLKADSDLTINGSNEVLNWEDQSVNGKIATAVNAPTKTDNAINFNPVVSFNGSNAGLEITNGILGTDTHTDMWVYTVQNIKTLNNSVLFRETMDASNRFGAHLPWGDGTAYYDFGVVTGSGRIQTNTNTIETNKTSLWTLATSTSTDTPSGFRKNISENGKSIVTSNNNNLSESRTGNNSNFYLGIVDASASGFDYDGDLAEMIIYSSKPSAFQQQKIQSYLAIKYGITLDRTDVSAAIAEGHYLNSNGDIIWNTYDNADYHNNIAIITRDITSGLEQFKSKSVNSGEILTIEKVGGITPDKAVVAIGSNSNSVTFTNKFAPPIYNILERNWKMQVTGNPGNISMSFTIPGNTGNIEDYAVILKTTNSDFSSGVSTFTSGNISGDEITFTNVTVRNGAFFTLGKKAPNAPGNVTQNIAVWIKPGSETINATSGITAIDGETVDTWNDLSGDDTKSFIKGVLQAPILRDNTTDNINYNSVVDFTGDDKGMYIGNSKYIYSDGVSSEDGMTWFAVVKPNDQASSKNQQFIYDFGNNSGDGYGFAYGDDNFYNYTSTGFGGVNSGVTNHSNATQTTLTKYTIDFNNSQSVHLNTSTIASKTDVITLAKLTANEINEFRTSAFQNAAGAFTIGRQSKAGGHIQNGGRSYDGKIAEIIGYRKVLSAIENKKVESYLAIKYGLTRDNTGLGDNGDYLDSNGDLIWDASFNPPSQNKIIGIGRDDKQQLLQKQSHTINDSIRLYVGSLATTNKLNAANFTSDRSYVLVGGVGKMCATPISNSEVPSPNITRMERELKITKSNFNDTFSIDFTMDSCANIAINKVRLMVDTDSNFDNGNTTLFANGNNGLSITYNSPVITVSGISSSHIPNNSIRWVTLTDINITLASVTTTDATLINGSFATLGGEVLGLGGTSVTERGIVYSSTNSTPEIGGANVIKNANGINSGIFSEVITGLNLATTYYYRSYAINTSGTAYGAVKSFTTLANGVNNYTASRGQWSTAASWSLGRTPIATDNVTILSGTAGSVDIANVEMNNLTTIGNVTVRTTSAITLNGDFTNSGQFVISSDATDSGVLIVKGSSSGNIFYSRGGLLANKWSLVSPPIQNQTIVSFAQDSRNDIRVNTTSDPDRYAIGTYNSANTIGNRWEYFDANTDSNLLFTIGTGYSMSRATDGNLIFEGPIEVNDINQTVSANQWNAIGNSFTSYYPINKNSGNSFLDDNNTKLEIPAVYVWNASQEKFIAITNLVSSTEQFLPPAQGFFVRPNVNSTLLFDDDKRSIKPVSGTHNFSRTTESTPYLKLFVQKESIKINTDIIYSKTATTGFDSEEDIQNFDSASFDVNTHLVENSDGKNYTIQSLPKSELEDLVVPINVKASANDNLIISLESFNFPSEINIYIEDKLTNKLIKLNEQNTEYTVTLEENISGTGRFYLRITSETLSTNSINLSGVVLYKYNNTTVRFTGLLNQKGIFKLFDMLGKQILKTSFEGKSSNDIQLPNLKAAVYIIELQTAKGKINKKIIIE